MRDITLTYEMLQVTIIYINKISFINLVVGLKKQFAWENKTETNYYFAMYAF